MHKRERRVSAEKVRDAWISFGKIGKLIAVLEYPFLASAQGLGNLELRADFSHGEVSRLPTNGVQFGLLYWRQVY